MPFYTIYKASSLLNQQPVFYKRKLYLWNLVVRGISFWRNTFKAFNKLCFVQGLKWNSNDKIKAKNASEIWFMKSAFWVKFDWIIKTALISQSNFTKKCFYHSIELQWKQQRTSKSKQFERNSNECTNHLIVKHDQSIFE